MGNLSRQYRPKRFADITGQQSIIQTLKKEVEQSKLGHAYLFSGPRGIGKTSVARIFAKAVNCLDQRDGEPCLKCASCLQINSGSAIDILEIDAASHTGVANVREAIIDHIQFVPANLKFKVYILDEAHMLSDSSWNALLKTVEEPPDYAIFIFATTEQHKVPATIISRCQRFEFTKIKAVEIIARLKKISENEQIKVDDEVFTAIAARTEGCLRDAENILGQLFSLGLDRITSDSASLILPPSGLPVAADLLKSTIEHDTASVLRKIQMLEEQGFDLIQLFDDLIDGLRLLLTAKNLPENAQSLKQTGSGEKILAELIQKITGPEIINASLILMERRREAKHGLNPRFALELGLSAITYCMNSETPPPIPALNQKTAPQPPAQTPTVKNIISPKIDTKIKTVDEAVDNKETDQTASVNQNRSDTQIQLADVQAVWSKFLQTFEEHKSLLFILKPSRVTQVKNNCIEIQFQYPYHLKTTVENPKNKHMIEDAFRKLLNNSSITILGSVLQDSGEKTETRAKDIVNNLIDTFGGQIN